MRISGGKARGIPLRSRKAKGLRPASEANRERLFSSIGDQVSQTRILDLFAGTGSYGLEGLSRGALHATFVEKNRKVSQDLRENITGVLKSACLPTSAAKVIVRDVLNLLKAVPPKPFDLIFLDPPYLELNDLREQLFNRLLKNKFVHSNSILIHECPAGETESPEGWRLFRILGKASKGSPIFHLFQKSE